MSDPNSPHLPSSLPTSLAKGIHFSCTDCGACCTGSPGRVKVTDQEIKAISELRKIPESSFRASEIRVVEGEYLLREEDNGDCIFFKHNRCQIHAAKPRQCRTYPFWFRNVRSDEAWAKTCRECPGIGQGTFYPAEDISELIREEL